MVESPFDFYPTPATTVQSLQVAHRRVPMMEDAPISASPILPLSSFLTSRPTSQAEEQVTDPHRASTAQDRTNECSSTRTKRDRDSSPALPQAVSRRKISTPPSDGREENQRRPYERKLSCNVVPNEFIGNGKRKLSGLESCWPSTSREDRRLLPALPVVSRAPPYSRKINLAVVSNEFTGVGKRKVSGLEPYWGDRFEETGASSLSLSCS